MKIVLQLVLPLLFLLSVIEVSAQQKELSAGRAPFNKANNHINYGTFPLATVAYGNDNQTSNNISIPIPAGTPFTVLGSFSAPYFASSMCKGRDGNFYLVDLAPALYLFDPVSGTCTLLGNITGMNGDQPNGLSFNPANESYYICSATKFYSFDINTLAATLIGPLNMTSGGSMIDLCFDNSGNCYSYEINTDAGAANAYIIDINSGNASPIGYLGFTPNYGQGMSYDFETRTIYLSAFNYDTFSGQLRTMDKETGNTTLMYDWGDQIAAFALDTQYGPPCPVEAAGNPNPPSGVTNISINGTTLTWDNGSGTTGVEVWFGPNGNIDKVYDGSSITSWPTGALVYYTTYHWFIKCKNDTCSTAGPNWNFKTQQNPLNTFFYPQSIPYWTGTTDGSIKTDPSEVRTIDPESGWMVFDVSSISPYATISSITFYGYVNAANWPYWSATPMGDVNPVTDDAAAIKNQILAGYDQSVAYIYSDESSSFTTGWHNYLLENNAIPDLQSALFSGRGWFAVGFVDRDFTPTYFLNFDGWSQPNLPYLDISIELCLSCPPFPPGNLTAQEIFNLYPRVQLVWQDYSWDEFGFNIHRKHGYPNDPGQYELIGEVNSNVVQYIDSTIVVDSTYSYVITSYNDYGSSVNSDTATITILPIPVELTSFRADVNEGNVILNWQTATETNNKGFEVQRSEIGAQRSEWKNIGFVPGNGTTTLNHQYSFIDRNVKSERYCYRLKQIDYDGSSEYSNTIEVNVELPKIFSLEQNYPNPFNPETQINFSLAEDSKVTLKVFDILGREVATLLNGNITAGIHSVAFNASGFPSGVYIYRIEANGLKGSTFTSVKKMVLMR